MAVLICLIPVTRSASLAEATLFPGLIATIIIDETIPKMATTVITSMKVKPAPLPAQAGLRGELSNFK